MLGGDDLAAAREQAAKFPASTTQFWDGSQLLGKRIAADFGAATWTAWDVYLWYPPGASLDKPAGALAQAGGVVVGTPGLLPAIDKPSKLPNAVVVGEQDDLGALLARASAKLRN